MMSLVAYGSSGESENESDNEIEAVAPERENSAVNGMCKDKSSNQLSAQSNGVETQKNSSPLPVSNDDEVKASSSKSGLHSKLPAPKTVVEEIIEEIEEEPSLAVGSMLPAPKHHTTPSLIESSLVISKGPKGRKGPVKITIPSLSDFPEEEEEPKARKKIQPSAKGSGLFALLPPPKQAFVKQANRSLVPNVLTRKPNPIPPVKKPATKPAAQLLKRKQPDSDAESDGENDDADFFSLNKEDKLPEIPISEISTLATSNLYQHAEDTSSVNYGEPSSSYQQTFTHTEYQYQPYNNQATSSDAGAIPQADSGQNFISFTGNEDLQLDDEAIKKLCGRRRREEIQILDVSGDQIMPDQREWLTKQLTEEQPQRSSKSKLNGPSSQQKRKHQITYLAHLAKENEIELKNQWANNRQTRKQTQSKYGF